MPFLRELDTDSHPHLHRNKHTEMSPACRWGQNQTSVEKTKPLWFNEPATCAKGVCESRDDLRIKKYTHLGAFQSSSHFQSQREFGWFQPVLLTATHPGVAPICSRAPGEDGSSWCCSQRPGAGQESQCSGKAWMWWRYICENRRLFVNTRAGVLMQNPSVVQLVAVHRKRRGRSCWQSSFLFQDPVCLD